MPKLKLIFPINLYFLIKLLSIAYDHAILTTVSEVLNYIYIFVYIFVCFDEYKYFLLRNFGSYLENRPQHKDQPILHISYLPKCGHIVLYIPNKLQILLIFIFFLINKGDFWISSFRTITIKVITFKLMFFSYYV